MYTDKLEVHILELPKLSKFEYPKTELLEWAHFFAAESNWNAGVKQGISIGISQGRVALVCKKLLKGQSVEQIAAALEETVENITKICEVANKFAPDYDVEKICRALQDKKD